MALVQPFSPPIRPIIQQVTGCDQRSPMWLAMRKQAKYTASTLFKSLRCSTPFCHDKPVNDFSLSAMQWGSDNEKVVVNFILDVIVKKSYSVFGGLIKSDDDVCFSVPALTGFCSYIENIDKDDNISEIITFLELMKRINPIVAREQSLMDSGVNFSSFKYLRQIQTHVISQYNIDLFVSPDLVLFEEGESFKNGDRPSVVVEIKCAFACGILKKKDILHFDMNWLFQCFVQIALTRPTKGFFLVRYFGRTTRKYYVFFPFPNLIICKPLLLRLFRLLEIINVVQERAKHDSFENAVHSSFPIEIVQDRVVLSTSSLCDLVDSEFFLECREFIAKHLIPNIILYDETLHRFLTHEEKNRLLLLC